MPSAEVNSVIISPHPPRLRMNLRNTVSVTPAIGASTVAGARRTSPIVTEEGTGTAWVARTCSPAAGPEVSQYLRTALFYLSPKTKPPPKKRGLGIGKAWLALFLHFFAGSALAYFRRKRSTRPAVSRSFCLPVKNG